VHGIADAKAGMTGGFVHDQSIPPNAAIGADFQPEGVVTGQADFGAALT
jgi:hypothetical protein